MAAVEPNDLAEPQDMVLYGGRKAYHSPEFRDYGTVGDLTRTSPFVNPIAYDNSYSGYINQTS